MKHKTSELTGALLDAAVAQACGLTWRVIYSRGLYGSKEGWTCIVDRDDSINVGGGDFNPSTNPATAWPIIERENIQLGGYGTSRQAEIRDDSKPWVNQWGETLLIAAMRAFVASKLGEEVDL